MDAPRINLAMTVTEVQWLLSAVDNFAEQQTHNGVRDCYYRLREKLLRAVVLSNELRKEQ